MKWLGRLSAVLLVAVASSKGRGEEPVYFADANLKAAVEAALGKTNPTPTDMLNLTMLGASKSSIIDLTGLEYAANLQWLSLGHNQITDIQPLSGLMNLRNLYLTLNPITNIEPLSGLINLEVLILKGTEVSDIQALSGLKNLRELVIWSPLSNIEPLSGLTNLEYLYIGGSKQISDIQVLSGLTNLRSLTIIGTSVSNFQPLLSLTNLYSLVLNSNEFSNIQLLSAFTNLRALYLAGNQITNIQPLSGLTNLTNLNLDYNQITDIEPLSGLTSLETLWISSNQITNIEPLSGLTNLVQLDMSSNRITNLQSLSGMSNLWNLWLKNNQISNIEPLTNIRNLQFLDLRSNPLNWDAYDIYIPLILQNNPGIRIMYDPPPTCKIRGHVTYNDDGQQGNVVGIPVYVYQEGVTLPVWRGTSDIDGYYEVDSFNPNYSPNGPQRFYVEAKWEDELIRIENSRESWLPFIACLWWSGEEISIRTPPSGYAECATFDVDFAHLDADQVHSDANDLLVNVHEAHDYITGEYQMFCPKIDGFVLADIRTLPEIPIEGAHCFGKIAFMRGRPAFKDLVWHEYGHFVHYLMTDSQRLSSSAIGEGWAEYFGVYITGIEIDSDRLYQQLWTQELSWGRVYSSIFNDIADGSGALPDDDQIEGYNTGCLDNNGRPISGEMMVWNVIMKDKATDIDDFYLKFVAKYGKLQTDLDSIYRAHGLSIPPSGTTSSGRIPPTGTATTITLIDSTVAQGRFPVSWPGSDLDLTLTSPSGTEINPAYAEQDPNITYVEEQTEEYYIIENPEPGQWQMHITSVDVPPEGENYSVTAYLTTNLILLLSTNKETYNINEPIVLTAKLLYNGSSYSDANVIAEIETPQGTEAIPLFDDGLHNDANSSDGVYANIWTNTAVEGQYSITSTASGQNPFGEPFVREARKTIVVRNLPDLVPVDLAISNDPITGQKSLTATTANIGIQTATEVFVEFYDVNDSNMIRIGESIRIESLEPQQTKQVSVEWNPADGKHNVLVVVDPLNSTAELNETNNLISRTFCIGWKTEGNVNNDCVVNFLDIADLANCWLDNENSLRCNNMDFDHSGRIDFADLLIIASHWLEGSDM